MTNTPKSDEELLTELAVRLNSLEAVAEREEVSKSLERCSEIVKALTESRKGMFTEEDMKEFGLFMRDPNWKNIDADFQQYLTERKGRG